MWIVAEVSCTYILYCILLYILSVNLPDPQSATSPPVTATPGHSRLPLYLFIIYEING